MQFRNFRMHKIFVLKRFLYGGAPYEINVVQTILERKFWRRIKANDGILRWDYYRCFNCGASVKVSRQIAGNRDWDLGSGTCSFHTCDCIWSHNSNTTTSLRDCRKLVSDLAAWIHLKSIHNKITAIVFPMAEMRINRVWEAYAAYRLLAIVITCSLWDA